MHSLLHISPIYNRSSIQNYGIMPAYVNNTSHRESFIEDKCATKDGKAIYTWMDCEKNEKFIKDLIYAKIWIHPRNDFYEQPGEDGCYIDFRYFHRKPIYKYSQMVYDVYLISSDTVGSRWYIRVQEPEDSITHTCHTMHEAYAHNDKNLFIFPEALKDFKIIGQALYYYDNNINIKIIR